MLPDKNFAVKTVFSKASLQIKVFCVTSPYLVSISKSIAGTKIVI